MQLVGQTEADLVAWALSRGAAVGAARALARALLAETAGRTVHERPANALLGAAREQFDAALPGAEAVPDADGTVRFAVQLSDGNIARVVRGAHARGPRRRRCRRCGRRR